METVVILKTIDSGRKKNQTIICSLSCSVSSDHSIRTGRSHILLITFSLSLPSDLIVDSSSCVWDYALQKRRVALRCYSNESKMATPRTLGAAVKSHERGLDLSNGTGVVLLLLLLFFIRPSLSFFLSLMLTPSASSSSVPTSLNARP